MKLTKIELILVVLALLSATFTIAGASMGEDASALNSPGAYHPPSWEPGPIAYPPPYLIAPTHFPWDRMPTLPPQSNRYREGLPHVPPPFLIETPEPIIIIQDTNLESGSDTNSHPSSDDHPGRGSK